MPSYHDLHITTAKLSRSSVFDLPFAYDVRCCRTAGWQLWYHRDNGEELLAGEYDEQGLRLDVGGVVIVDSLGPHPESSFPFLGIARKHDLAYGEVIRFINVLDEKPSYSTNMFLEDWEQEAVTAWAAENRRRLEVAA